MPILVHLRASQLQGLMRKRIASINEAPIRPDERRIAVPEGQQPAYNSWLAEQVGRMREEHGWCWDAMMRVMLESLQQFVCNLPAGREGGRHVHPTRQQLRAGPREHLVQACRPCIDLLHFMPGCQGTWLELTQVCGILHPRLQGVGGSEFPLGGGNQPAY